MRRTAVVQGILSLFEKPRYLEIGVNKGDTFHAVKADRKVGVDPKFLFDVEAAKLEHSEATYHRTTSDDYFGRIIARDERFDVIYVDGLHTSEQTLRDLLNAIYYLSDDGIIILDDVLPPTYIAAIPDREKFQKMRAYLKWEDKSWMGDVFRLVFFIETFCQQFSFRTVSDNHGQAVIWRSRRTGVPNRTISAVGDKTFEDRVLENETFRLTPFATILKEIQADRQVGAQP